MLSTERDYVRDLQSIILGYQHKIRHLLTDGERSVIFGNINDIHALHCELLAGLEDCIEVMANLARQEPACMPGTIRLHAKGPRLHGKSHTERHCMKLAADSSADAFGYAS